MPSSTTKDDADRVGLRVAIAARPHGGERIAVLCDLDRQVFDRLFDRIAVIDVAPDASAGTERSDPRIDGANVGLNVDRCRSDIAALPRW